MAENRRSQEINAITRQSLAQALGLLMETIPFSKITVTALCRQAGVSRNAYYRNFTSLTDILREYLSGRWDAYYELHRGEYQLPDNLGELFCAYIYSERRFITLLNRDGLMQVLEDLLYESLGPGEDVTGADLYLKSCWAYLVYGFIVAMVRSGFPDRPEEIAALLKAVQAGTGGKLEKG